MYLLTDYDGVVEATKLKKFKALFCKHRKVIQGEACSKNGMRRISGSDTYVICTDCGKILSEQHINYGG